jgi:predicted anti-sigma-YlaC factor YlaD
MICKEVHKKMNSYLNQELAAKQLQAFELHLKDCASCRQIINEVKTTMSLIDRTEKLSSDLFMFTRIQAQIENRYPESSRNWTRLLQPIAIAMLMGIGIISGISLGSKYYSNSFQLHAEEYEVDSQDEDLYLNALAYESIESFLLTEN